MKSYLTFSTVRHTPEVYKRFSATVHSIPYKGPERNRLEYYRQIRVFLQHLDHCQSYNHKKNPYLWVPVPWKLLRKELPLLFERQRTKLTRGRKFLLDKETGILESKGYSFNRHLCREYRIKAGIRHGWYYQVRDLATQTDLASYKLYARTCNLAKTTAPKHLKGGSWEEAIKESIRIGIGEPKRPDVSRLRRSKEAQDRYNAAYANLHPVQVNIDILLKVLWFYEAKKFKSISKENERIARTYVLNASIRSILSQGTALVEESRRDGMTLAYYPKYRIAPIGGRGFEVGGGFQTLKQWVKIASCPNHNYDISNSQLTILQLMMTERGITSSFFKDYPNLNKLAKELGIDRIYTKPLLYGLIFNAGRVVIGPYGSGWRALRRAHGENRTRHIQGLWKDASADLSCSIKKLVDQLWAEGKPGRARSWTSPTLIRFTANERDPKAERQLLAHYLQGTEADLILRTMEDPHNYVCALEHDGFMGNLASAPDGPLNLELQHENGYWLQKRIMRCNTYDEMLTAVSDHSKSPYAQEQRFSELDYDEQLYEEPDWN